MKLMSYVKKLEGKSDIERKDIITNILLELGFDYKLEMYDYFGCVGENIIVSLGRGKKEILIGTHYDVVENSPGANDNGSTIAVVFDVLNKLKNYRLKNRVRFVIFDDEELDCIGSRAYIKQHGIKDIIAVYNMELVGMGDMLGIWPVTKDVKGGVALKILRETIKKLGYYYEEAGKLPLFFGDYKPFRQAGLKDSFCISVIPKKEKEEIRKFVEVPKVIILPAIIFKVFKKFVKKPKAIEVPGSIFKLTKIPKFFRHYHSSEGKSKYLNENALKMTSDVLFNAIISLDKIC